mmetsp:Transcript_2598/g.4212  ORF Transcript_2598/g.4212 Transcript_2598/m.4212 type:complete len:148 (+) Transcript_2598:212-655(+)
MGEAVRQGTKVVEEEHNGQLRKIRREVRAWWEKEEESIERLVAGLPKRLKRALEQVSKENVSFWLTASPLKQYGSDLYVGVFCDSLNLRHGHEGLRGLPAVCNDGCGAPFFYFGVRPELQEVDGCEAWAWPDEECVYTYRAWLLEQG